MNNTSHSLLPGKFDLWKSFLTVFLLVDSYAFLTARMVSTVLFVKLYFLFFFVSSSAIITFRKSGREGRISLFVIFPSDARSSSWWKVGLPFYSDTSSLCSDVAPVRRREDTERDRDSGVKVQIDWSEGVLSRMPSEPFWNNSKGRQEETLASGERGWVEGRRWGWRVASNTLLTLNAYECYELRWEGLNWAWDEGR